MCAYVYTHYDYDIIFLHIYICMVCFYDFPGVSVVKSLPPNAEYTGLIPGLGETPGEGNGNPLHYSYLGNPRTE